MQFTLYKLRLSNVGNKYKGRVCKSNWHSESKIVWNESVLFSNLFFFFFRAVMQYWCIQCFHLSFSCLLSSYSFVTIYIITSLFVTILRYYIFVTTLVYLTLEYTHSRRKLSKLISGSIVSRKPWLVNRIKMENTTAKYFYRLVSFRDTLLRLSSSNDGRLSLSYVSCFGN